MKTSIRIVNYESQVIKWNPELYGPMRPAEDSWKVTSLRLLTG